MVIYIVGICFVSLIIGVLLVKNRTSALMIVGVVTPSKIRRFRRPLLRLVVTIQLLLGIRRFSGVILISVGAWLLECVSLFTLTRGIGSPITFLQDMLVFSLGTVAGALSALPGGLGVAEGSMVGLFIYFRLSRTTAMSVTLLIRLVTLWLGVWIGFVTFAVTSRHFFYKRRSKT